MDIFFPKYYSSFRCIAGKCPDSCCKEWNVDVDEEAARFYRELEGPLGDRLREVLQDTPDGTIMRIQDGRCPMWRQDGLCQIQAELGHDALCKTCREFPRLRHDYGDFVELGLELSCPEAARLILNDTENLWETRTDAEVGSAEYDEEIMEILRRSRGEFVYFLHTTALSVPKILAVLLLYAYDVQEELDGGVPAILTPEQYLQNVAKLPLQGDIKSLQKFFMGLEILTPQWEARLRSPSPAPFTDTYRLLARYFVERYWLQAVSDYDLCCRVKFLVVSCLVIAALGGDFLQTAQLFSKEIENNAANVDTLLDAAYTHPALTDDKLLGLLLAQGE